MISTAGGDILNAVNLVVLDFNARSRSVTAILLTAVFGCCGAVFANSSKRNNGAALLGKGPSLEAATDLRPLEGEQLNGQSQPTDRRLWWPISKDPCID